MIRPGLVYTLPSAGHRRRRAARRRVRGTVRFDGGAEHRKQQSEGHCKCPAIEPRHGRRRRSVRLLDPLPHEPVRGQEKTVRIKAAHSGPRKAPS
jgi:hypothetical protein